MIINNAILHIIDANSNSIYNSTEALNLNEKFIFDYLEKKLSMLLTDTKAKKGEFQFESKFLTDFNNFINDKLNFIDYSFIVVKSYKELLEKTDEYFSSDLIVCDFEEDSTRYFAAIFISFKDSFTHYTDYNEEGKISNKIIKYNYILSSGITKPESYFLINLSTMQIRYIEHARHYNGNEYLILSKGLLECSKTESTQESISKIKKAVKEIVKDQDLNTTMMLSKVENYISKADNEISVEELTEKVFSNDLEHKTEFKKKIEQKAVPKEIKLEADTICKKSEIHKIKTDTGIEIKFPSEYSLDNEYINFKYNEDGTIIIEITNITKIIN